MFAQFGDVIDAILVHPFDLFVFNWFHAFLAPAADADAAAWRQQRRLRQTLRARGAAAHANRAAFTAPAT